MKLYGDANGTILRVLQDTDEEAIYGPPDAFVSTLVVDVLTNLAVVAALKADWNTHRLIDGVLYRDNQAVTINPPGEAWVQRERQEASRSNAQNIPGWASWTEDEAAAWFDTNVSNLLAALPDVSAISPTQYNNNAQSIAGQYQDILVAQAQVIRALARMVLALRNHTWPDLEG